MNIERKNLPIGVFDSGIGGLTIVREINRVLPAENILFLADRANLPYGEKSEDEIMELTQAIVPMLITEGAKLIVIACNSASLAVVERLRKRYPETPFVAVVPAVKLAAARTKNGTVAVFATETTLKSALYEKLKTEHAGDVTVIDIPCPKWVRMIESGEISGPDIKNPIEEALRAGADQLVLGCTHYPFLADYARSVAHNRAELLESSSAVVKQVRRILIANEMLATGGHAVNRYLTSSQPERSGQVASMLLDQPIRFQSVRR